MKESDKNKKEMAVLEDSQQQIAFEVEDYLKKNYLLRYNMMTRRASGRAVQPCEPVYVTTTNTSPIR